MNFSDFLIPWESPRFVSHQLGSMVRDEIPENGIAFIWVSDYRGANQNAESRDFRNVRKKLYNLSKLDFEVPCADLGELVSGKTIEDSHYVLQEVISACLYKNTVPVIIGGSTDFTYSLFSVLNFHQKNIVYSAISDQISFSNEGESINENNCLTRLFSTKNFSIKEFNLLGYQNYLNDSQTLGLLKDIDFEIVRLAEMMGTTEKTEPFLRHADLVTVNCNSVESFAQPFSIDPRVNGLNRREICGYMKEIGLGQQLKCVGVFNYDFNVGYDLNDQLLAQMIWHLVEGINIQRTHPVETKFETFMLLVDENDLVFKRDVFRNLWYFGDSENIIDCIPCSAEDFESAKRGIINKRLLKKR